ncbi:hypothetical protein [Paenibacillus tarimensis]|uniref:hypothetical protein n=1 Tax=Paenibacillus tarimensis TaxID=416012 RepID=UPI001F167C7C|nr:hypothetical protein [Paenibacillus tarimensis]MCF2942242.1 hypothetical protein [Paenibacillus tarimensis]
MSSSPLQTEEEIQLIKEYILLPVMFDVLERDIQTMDTLRLKLPHFYIRSLQAVQKTVLMRQIALRKELARRGMKVIHEERRTACLRARYLCRGYEHKMDLIWEIVKAEIEVALAAHFQISGD